MPQGEQINPGVLVWARESAGLNLRDAAHKLALAASDDVSSETKLLELERGTRLPSRTQLSKIARTYRRPLLTFDLAAHPQSPIEVATFEQQVRRFRCVITPCWMQSSEISRLDKRC